MKNINKTYGLMLALVILIACVKPYDFDPQRFDKVLVIDAALYDSPGPYTVDIAYTYPLDTVLNEKVSGAGVYVVVDGSQRVDFIENRLGVYTSPDGFRGVASSTYQLFVELADGSTFQSTPEILNPAPEIDIIYGSYLQRPDDDNLDIVDGIQFFVDSKSDESGAKYFRYEWEEAYKIQVPFPAAWVLEFVEEMIIDGDTIAADTLIVPIETKIGTCYTENASKGLFIGSTLGTTEGRIIEFPIRYISRQTQELRTRYTILVKQFAISEAAYFFYKELKENNESGGSLFDQQPGTVFGNIKSSGDAEEPVLGFFEVSGVTEKRSFFSRRDLDDRFRTPDFRFSCYQFNQINTVADSAYYYLNRQGGNIYDYSELTGALSIQTLTCTDCSYYAETTPPDYWVE